MSFFSAEGEGEGKDWKRKGRKERKENTPPPRNISVHGLARVPWNRQWMYVVTTVFVVRQAMALMLSQLSQSEAHRNGQSHLSTISRPATISVTDSSETLLSNL